MNASAPRTSPESYRFQVHAVTELDRALMSGEWPTVSFVAGIPFLIGECLWDEPAGRECDWTVSARVRSVMEHAGRLATIRGERVGLCTKSFTDEPARLECLEGGSVVLAQAVAL